jgi:hypothetical protein
MRAHVRSIRTLVWAGVLVGVAIVLAFTPLFNVLGFEFAFAMAFFGSVASADLGAAFVRRVHATDAPPLERAQGPVRIVAEIAGRAVVVNLSLLLAPLILISINALRVRNCDWWFGIETFLLMTCVSCVIATSVGVLCGLAAGRRRKLSNALPYLVIAASAVFSLWSFYSKPAVFSYNMFVGYFPGNLYDENIALREPFYWARLFHVSMMAALYCLVIDLIDVPSLRLKPSWRPRRPAGLRLIPVGCGVLSAVLAAVLWLESGSLRFSIDADDIADELGAVHTTEHFRIYFSPGGDIERDIELIGEDHEFRYAQVVREFGARPSGKLVSFYFSSADHKFEMMGARNVYMAKPWRKEIYLHHSSFPHAVLRHEVAHAVAGAFGDSTFNVSVRTWLGLPLFFNVGLIEGAAVAADWPDHFNRALTPHQSVKAMIELGFAPPIGSIMSTGFLRFSSARSYTVAGSFVRYLLDTRGNDQFRTLYRTGGDFDEAYGESETSLIEEWRAMIDAIELPEGAAEIVRERFRRPGILHRPCAHAIANQRNRVAHKAARGDLDGAIALMTTVCDQVPREPRYQLDLAGLYARAERIDDATAIYDAISGNAEEMSSSLRAEALSALAAIEARAGEFERADAILARAEALPLGDDELRNIEARRYAAMHSGPSGPAMRAYFWGNDGSIGIDPILYVARAAQIIAMEPTEGMGYYLLGRNMHSRGAPAETARMLADALDHGLPGPRFVRACARLLAESAYMAGDLELVGRAARILDSDGQPDVTRLYGKDWLERIHWKRTGELLPR